MLAVIYRSAFESHPMEIPQYDASSARGKTFIEAMPSIRTIVDNFVDPGMIRRKDFISHGEDVQYEER